jgi:uncharacterized protein (TIGR00369 family)
MDWKSHYSKLAKMYLGAPTNQYYDGLALEISEEACTITVDVQEKMFHAAGAMHGAHYFKLLDDAAFFAANSIVPDVFVLTSAFQINLLRPITGGSLRSEGKIHFKSRNLIVAESVLYDHKGRKMGSGTGQFMKSKIELTPEIGYA